MAVIAPVPFPSSARPPAQPIVQPAAAQPVPIKKPRFSGVLAPKPVEPEVIKDTDPRAGLAIPGTISETEAATRAAAPKPPRFKGAVAPQPEFLLDNAAAGPNEALIGIATFLPWVFQQSMNAGQYTRNVVDGNNTSDNMPFPDADGGRAAIGGLLEKVGIKDPEKVKANTLAEKLTRAFTGGAVAVGAPEVVLPRLFIAMREAGIVGDDAVRLVQAIAGEGKNAPQVLKDAISGGIGMASIETLPEDQKARWGIPLAIATGVGAAGLMEAIPAAARAGGRLVSDAAAPLTKGGRERLAGERLTEAADNPASAQQAIRDREQIVPGSEGTTGQVTGDMGLLAAERGAAARDPAAFQQRRSEQNAARVSAIEDLQTTGAPESVVPAIREHLANIERQVTADIDEAMMAADRRIAAARQSAEAGVANATKAAQDRAAGIGDSAHADIAGNDLRHAYETTRQTAKDAASRLWVVIDPDGTLALRVSNLKNTATQILGSISKVSKPMEGEELRLFKAAQALPNVTELSLLDDLRIAVGDALRAERRAAGETGVYRRLSKLNDAVLRELDNAVAEKVSQENVAVAAGKMLPEDTIAVKLQAYGNNYWAVGDTQPVSRSGNLGPEVSAEGSAAVSPVRGAARNAGEGFSDGTGDQSVPPDVANFDQTANDRLKAARAGWKTFKETFDNKTLAPLRRRPTSTAAYDVPDSAVPQKIFYPRPQSYDAIQTFRNAVGDGEAMLILESYAIGKLRTAAMRADGTLDTGKAQVWLRNHSDALRAFPDLDVRIRGAASSTKAMDDAISGAKKMVDDAEKAAKADTVIATKAAEKTKKEAESGAVGKLLGTDDPEEVVRIVGSIFARKDAAREMARLRRASQGNPAALEGLRKAVVDFIVKKFVSNAEAGTSGVGTIKSDGFQSFVRDNSGALRAAGLTAEEVTTMQRVAADLRQANRSVVAVKLPGGSNTTQDVLAAKANENSWSMLSRIAAASLVTGVGTAALTSAIPGVLATVATGVFAALRQRGIQQIDDLIREALLNPDLALKLMQRVKPKTAPEQAKGIIAALSPSSIVRSLKSND